MPLSQRSRVGHYYFFTLPEAAIAPNFRCYCWVLLADDLCVFWEGRLSFTKAGTEGGGKGLMINDFSRALTGVTLTALAVRLQVERLGCMAQPPVKLCRRKLPLLCLSVSPGHRTRAALYSADIGHFFTCSQDTMAAVSKCQDFCLGCENPQSRSYILSVPGCQVLLCETSLSAMHRTLLDCTISFSFGRKVEESHGGPSK